MNVPASTNVFFVRHAESQANLDKDEIAHGWRDAYPRSLQDERDADVLLTARGVAQARATGRHLAANLGAFDACYVSPWLRTRHTFDHLLTAYPEEQRDAMRAATRYEERLREHEQGIVTRLTPAQIAARYPEEAHRQATDGPYYYRPSGGESWADVSQRLAPVLDACARTRPGGRLLVVAHSTVILCARKLLLGLDEEEIVTIFAHAPVRNCAINHVTYDGSEGVWRLKRWDEVVYGADLASTVPDHHQRQGPPDELEPPADARPQGS